MQRAGARQLGDGAAFERGDPVDARHRAHRIDLHSRDHAAIADHHQRLEPELRLQLFNLRQQRLGVGRVALEHRHRDRAAAHLGHEAIVHLQRTGLAIAAVAEFCQRAGDAFKVARREIEQHHASSSLDQNS